MSRKSSSYTVDLNYHLDFSSTGYDVEFTRPRHLSGLSDKEWENWLRMTTRGQHVTRSKTAIVPFNQVYLLSFLTKVFYTLNTPHQRPNIHVVYMYIVYVYIIIIY